MNYSVAEVAKMLNISPHTVRYYDDQGLLPFLKRDANGRRIFSDYDVKMLEAVYRGIKVGNLQIREMRELIGASVLRENFLEGKMVLEKYRSRLAGSAEQLQASIRFLDDTISQYDRLIKEQNDYQQEKD